MKFRNIGRLANKAFVFIILGIFISTSSIINAEEQTIAAGESGQMFSSDTSFILMLENFKITEKDNSTIKGSFVAKNMNAAKGEDLTYVMEIYKDNDLAEAVLVDTKSYPFDILANQTKTVDFTYEVSDKIKSGVYHAIIKVLGKDGVPIGIIMGDIGEIIRPTDEGSQTGYLTLKEDSVKIIKDNEELSPLSSPSYKINESPKGEVTFANNTSNTISCYPKFTVYPLDDNTSIVEVKGSLETFEPNETKTIGLNFPAGACSGIYQASVIMLDESDKVVSSTCEFKYKFTGKDEDAKILSIDFQSEEENTNQDILVSVVGSAYKSEIKQAAVILKLFDKDQTELKSEQQLVDLGGTAVTVKFQIDASILTNASKVEVSIIKDEKVLAESSAAFSGANVVAKIILRDVEKTKFKTAVNSLVGLGIISGYPDQTYRPYKFITRAEFAKVVCLAAGLNIDVTKQQTNYFKDVDKSHWANEYITIAAQNDLIKGYPGGIFKPDSNISYGEAITILVRLISDKRPEGVWPENYVQAGNELGLIKDFSITNNSDRVIRGDIALMTWNACQIKKK